MKNVARECAARLLGFALACAGTATAWAVDLQPQTYASPDGKYALTVNPSERNGAGPGTYTLKRGAQQQWSITLPFTLQDAVVDDEGHFGGYAYSGGRDRDDGEFVAAIVDADGKILAQERAPRSPSRYLHTPGNPRAEGLIRADDAHRLAIRVADSDVNAGVEAWWTFDLRDGHLVGKFQPKVLTPGIGRGWIIAARHIAKTPLTLVQWATSQGEDTGTRFTLVDANAAPVWTLDWPNDYTKLVDDPNDRLLYRLRDEGAILAADAPRAFDVWRVAKRTRVSYEIAPDPASASGWRISERARTPQTDFPIARSSRIGPPPKAGTLRPLGAITLNRTSGSTIRGISDFSIADGGRFAFLTGCGCEQSQALALVVVDREGRTLNEIALPVPRESASYAAVWTGGDRWIVTRSTRGIHSVSTAWGVDATTGTATRLAAFSAPDIKSLASLGDGGFVAITSDWSKHSMTQALFAFDASGARRWSIVGDSSDRSPIFSPESITVTTSHEVVVLDNIRDELQLFDAAGKFLRRINLEHAWHEPNYLTGVSADTSGGVVIHDFEGKPPIVHLKIDGHVVRQFDPAFDDGRRFTLFGHVQVADDGTYWTSDGSAILGLDTRGVVKRVVGEKPRLEALGNVAGMTVDAKGSIYAADERTGAVHVFDLEGRPVRVLRPAATDYDGKLGTPTLTVSDTGDVWITRHELATQPDFLHYGADGRRIGIESSNLDAISQEWYSQAGSSERWIVGYENAFLVAHDGKVLHRIDREANGNWLAHPGPAAPAADGTIAIVSGARCSPPGSDGPVLVTVYASDATPRATWAVPPGFLENDRALAWDGEHVAFLAATKGYAADHLVLDTIGARERSTFPVGAKPGAAVFLVRPAATPEIWLFDGDATIQRFAMPEPG